MIGVRLTGGLGNQMFQYAAARALSFHIGCDLILDTTAYRSYRLHRLALDGYRVAGHFQEKHPRLLWNPIIDSVAFRLGQMNGMPGRFYEKGFRYDPRIWLVKDGTLLFGYFQTEKYFCQYRQVLLDDFSLNRGLSPSATRIKDMMNTCFSVSLHVRRGDYVSDPKASKIHGVCSIQYYERAIAFFQDRFDRVRFFVFSDDIQWAKENLRHTAEFIFVDGTAQSAAEDLHLMSQAKSHIIANSSYSWWGAWLGQYKDKLVVAPKRWFAYSEIDSADVVPDRWIRV